MISTVTWKPGTNKELDDIFDRERSIQFQSDHRLAKNYSDDFYKFSVAFTIAFNDQQEPEICSSIARRACWPLGVYRIMNRLWKTENHRVAHSKFISEAMAGNARSQIDWLKNNADCKLLFISREKSNWMQWVSDKFLSQYDIKFEIAKNKYLTCPNELDSSCWQNIIYIGDHTYLDHWKSI